MTLLAGTFALATPAYSKPPSPPTYYVAPTGGGGGSCGHPNFNTIQNAINGVSPGSTIIVCPGTYAEQITVAKSITLVGSGPLRSTILAPSTLSPDPNGWYSIVTIAGSGIVVSVSGFTVSGPGPGTCGSISNGIFVIDGATANIVGNVIAHIRDNPISSCTSTDTGRGAGTGILVGMQPDNNANVKIVGNVIYDYQVRGIRVQGIGSTAEITGNVITGVGPTDLQTQLGISVRAATATITSNIVSGNECTSVDLDCGPDLGVQAQGYGIDFIFGATATVANNLFYGNDLGIVGAADVNSVVTKNLINNNRFGNIVLYSDTNDVVSYNTVLQSAKSAAGGLCTADDTDCYPYSYTLGIDLIYTSGTTVYKNIVTVTADQYAILVDNGCTGAYVGFNTLRAGNGAIHGNAAVLDLDSSTIVGNG